MTKAIDVANAFLKLSEPESGDILTNLKLQKLVYYTQGFSLAMSGLPIFKENIIHWNHGPVVKELYEELCIHGSNPIPIPDSFNPNAVLNEDQLDLIKEVNSVYGQFSAWKLRDMTHSETPWRSTTKDQVISHDLLKDYFKTLLV